MHKIFLIMFLYCCAASNVLAQDKHFEYTDTSILKDPGSGGINENPDGPGNTIAEEKDILSDTTVYISNIVISADTITAWKKDKRFAYLKNIDSLLKLKQQEELDAYNKALKRKPDTFFKRLFASGILQLFFWTIAIAFVVLILYRLFLSNVIFGKDTASTAVQVLHEEELAATPADHDRLIQQAVMTGDHRMAVRYLFLKTLVQLGNKEYLHLSADKTNYQYVEEIHYDKKNEFASLVLNYEYIWYGNFPLSAESYPGIEKKFSSFYHKIQ